MAINNKLFEGCWQDPWLNFTKPWQYEPARNLQKSACAITGYFQSLKNSRSISHDSYQEKLLINCLEQAGDVSRFYEQPVSIPFLDETGHPRVYTADILVYFKIPINQRKRKSPLLIEVKPKKRLGEWCHDNKSRIIAAKEYARIQGWQFIFLTEDEIHQFIALIRWLNNQPEIEMSLPQAHLLDFLEKHGPTAIVTAAQHLTRIVGGLQAGSNVIGGLISEGFIQILGEGSPTWWSKICLKNGNSQSVQGIEEGGFHATA